MCLRISSIASTLLGPEAFLSQTTDRCCISWVDLKYIFLSSTFYGYLSFCSIFQGYLLTLSLMAFYFSNIFLVFKISYYVIVPVLQHFLDLEVRIFSIFLSTVTRGAFIFSCSQLFVSSFVHFCVLSQGSVFYWFMICNFSVLGCSQMFD